MKKRKQTMLTMLLLTLLTVVMLSEHIVYAKTNYDKKIMKKNTNFTVSVDYGMDGMVFYDMPAQVLVTVESKENFTGTLRIVPAVEYSGLSVVAYGEDVSLSAGEAKTFQFIPSSISNNGEVRIDLVNENGKVVYSEKNTIQLEGLGSKITVGILSDDYSALSYFDGLPLYINSYEGTSSIFELTKDTFPEDAKALAMLQYLIIDNYDTASLSDEQYAALKSWVQDGGVLFLALGNNYQNVLHRFQDDFVTGTLGDVKKRDIFWENVQYDATQELESDVDENAEEQLEAENQVATDVDSFGTGLEMDCIEFELEDGENLAGEWLEGSVCAKQIGFGQVVVLSYSLGMEPLSSSEYKSGIAKILLELAATNATVDKYNGVDKERNSMYSAVNVSKLADDSRKPSVLLYAFILIVYVIVVGPVLYLVLKKQNKREKIWTAIPIVTLIFTGIIYVSGFLYRINKPLVNTFTVIQLEDSVQSEKLFTTVVCPKPKEYTIKIADGYKGFRRNMDEYYNSLFGNTDASKDYDYMIKKSGKGSELVLDCKEAFQETSFVLDKNGDNNIGSLDGDLKCRTSGFEGSVTNNTCFDLQDVVVTYENYLCMIGDVKKGETVQVDPSKVIMMNTYGSFEHLYPETRLYMDRDMYRRYQINTTIENNIIDKNAYMSGYIWGSVKSYEPELVDGSNVKRAGCGAVMTTYTAEYEDVKGAYYPSIDNMAIAEQGDYDSMDKMIYSEEVVITYSFEEYPGITCLENHSVNQNASVESTYNQMAQVYAYNVQTGEYDLIFENSDTLSGADLKQYLMDDVIVLKYKQSGTGYNSYIPKICARGDQ